MLYMRAGAAQTALMRGMGAVIDAAMAQSGRGTAQAWYVSRWRMILAADVLTGMMDDSDIHLCLGMIQGSGARGVLLSGTLEELEVEMDKLDDATGEPRTTDELVQAVRKAGVNAGTCTLTLKR